MFTGGAGGAPSAPARPRRLPPPARRLGSPDGPSRGWPPLAPPAYPWAAAAAPLGDPPGPRARHAPRRGRPGVAPNIHDVDTGRGGPRWPPRSSPASWGRVTSRPWRGPASSRGLEPPLHVDCQGSPPERSPARASCTRRRYLTGPSAARTADVLPALVTVCHAVTPTHPAGRSLRA